MKKTTLFKSMLLLCALIVGSGSSWAYNYVKVTSTTALTGGKYLIVYEGTGDKHTDAVAFNGNQTTLDAGKNGIAVTINNNTIAGTDNLNAAVFTIDVTNKTIKSASGYYIGVSSYGNGLKTSETATTYTHHYITINNDATAKIGFNFTNKSKAVTMDLRYNSSTGDNNLRFRYYKDDGQKAIALYKQVPSTPSDPIDNGDNSITLTTTANMDGWRAFYDATQDYSVDANTTIYVAKKSATEDVVELTAVAATDIPHGEAVVLKTTDAGHSMTLTKTTGAATLGANVLAVTDGTNNVDGYRMGYGKIGASDAVGFFKYTTTTAPAAGIVYIDKSDVNVSAGAHGLAIDFGETTAIKTVNADLQNIAPRKLLKDGRIVVESAKGTFTLSGARMK